APSWRSASRSLPMSPCEVSGRPARIPRPSRRATCQNPGRSPTTTKNLSPPDHKPRQAQPKGAHVMTISTTITIPDLRNAVRGRLIGPDDADYDAAHARFYPVADARPAAIVRVADATDVARVIAIAREAGLELAVRSGGHSAAGYWTSDGGLVIDLGDLKGLDLDLDGRTAWAETGLTAGELSTRLA